MLTPLQLYITLVPSTILQTSKQPTNLPTQNPAHLPFPSLPSDLSTPKSKLKLLPLLHPTHHYICTSSPLTSDTPDNNSPVDTELERELDNFITHQQQLQHPHTLTIHQLSQSITSSMFPNPTPSTETRAHRTFKRKFPNTPFPTNPQPAQSFVIHPLHTSIKEFVQI